MRQKIVTGGDKESQIGITSSAARILRERSVSGLEFADLTYPIAPPLPIPVCTKNVRSIWDTGTSWGTYQPLRQAMLHVVNG